MGVKKRVHLLSAFDRNLSACPCVGFQAHLLRRLRFQQLVSSFYSMQVYADILNLWIVLGMVPHVDALSCLYGTDISRIWRLDAHPEISKVSLEIIDSVTVLDRLISSWSHRFFIQFSPDNKGSQRAKTCIRESPPISRKAHSTSIPPCLSPNR